MFEGTLCGKNKGKEMITINIQLVATTEKRRREIVTETACRESSEVTGKILSFDGGGGLKGFHLYNLLNCMFPFCCILYLNYIKQHNAP